MRKLSSYQLRKIYKAYHGPIPLDEEGRTYEIHHVDGNHNNNDPTNLQALSIQEHYDIHYSQGDWAACHRIATRMKLSPEIISELAKKRNNNLIKNGKHWFSLFGSEMNREKVANRTHNFLKENNPPAMEMYKKGIHPFQGQSGQKIRKEQNDRRLADGSHNFLDGEFHRKVQLKRLEEGTHHFLQPREIVICPHCNKNGPKPQMVQWHFDKCKYKGKTNVV